MGRFGLAVGVTRTTDRRGVEVDVPRPSSVTFGNGSVGEVTVGDMTDAGALGTADTAAGAGDGVYGGGAGVDEQPATIRADITTAAKTPTPARGRRRRTTSGRRDPNTDSVRGDFHSSRCGMVLYPHGHRR